MSSRLGQKNKTINHARAQNRLGDHTVRTSPIHKLAGAILFLALGTPLVSATPFTDELWAANRDVYEQILRHPFLRGMTDGTLDRQTFVRYLLQDAYYLHEFADGLKAAAAKSPRKDWADLLTAHANDSLAEELRLHESVFKEFGVSREDIDTVEPLPDAFAYTSFILAATHRGTFGEAMAAVLPCYWIYLEVGRELKKRGSPDPIYRKWIDAYQAPLSTPRPSIRSGQSSKRWRARRAPPSSSECVSTTGGAVGTSGCSGMRRTIPSPGRRSIDACSRLSYSGFRVASPIASRRSCGKTLLTLFST